MIGISIFVTLLGLLGCGGREVNGQTSEIKKGAYLTQLKTFEDLGFQFNKGIVIEEVWKQEDVSKFEKYPFSFMYMELGRTIQKEPWTPLTNRCWDFDTETIEDNGDYVEILKNLERISRGEVKFDNPKDSIDIENGKASVSFSIKGQRYNWKLEVDDDWADPNLFSKIVAVTKRINTKGKYTYFDTGGQNAVIGYETPEKLKEIVKATGLKITWLE